MATQEKVDVVIVGAGPAGAILAHRLSQAGKKVVILELGPNWTAGDLVSSQIWSRRIKWSGSHVELGGANPAGHNFSMGWGVGGSAIHHYAQWPRMHVEDFRMRSLFGAGADWPISYDDLRPYYDKVQTDVGVSGDHVKEVWRPPGAPYPMPPMKYFRQAEVLSKGFEAIGLRTSPFPLAINSVDYKGRPACLNDGWCDAGCPTGALVNPLFVNLPEAIAAGTDLRARAAVTRVLVSSDGKRATGVEYYDAAGTQHVQPAEIVILANNAIQGARVLLNSAAPGHANGLANASGTVGQYFLTHFSIGVSGMFDVDMENHMGVTGAAVMSQESYAKSSGSYTWLLARARKMTELIGIANTDGRLFGAKLHDFMRRAVRGLGQATAIGEQRPRAENRIVLGTVKDAYGFPVARWENGLDDLEKAVFATFRDEGTRALRAAGATETWAPERWGWQHLAGGIRMGADPASSVCDSYGRTHDVGNLVIAGAGIFPTQGAVNPTFTVYALTERTAEHMLANWTSYAA